MIKNDERITYFAETDARNKRVKFGIKAKDRTRHVYVIGKTGMGKSTLLENMAVQDIQNGEGMAFIDPHGKTAELLLEYVPKERISDVVYFAPFDLEYPISFNVLEKVDPDKRHLVVSGLMSTFKKIWQDAWSARMEYILTNTLLALLEYPDATLLGVNRMLSDKIFRNDVIKYITDPSVKSFWVDEFANYTERMAAEAVPAIQNKVGQFTANPLIRNLIGQPTSSFDFRKAMDQRKIIIINLSKGKVGDVNANLLGGLLITKIYLAAMSRADTPDRILKNMPNFYLFVDEFQNFANESFADILSEARKYNLNLTVAHQYIEQMEEEVRAAVFGNVGTMITFRVGAFDAEVLEKEFAPQFTMEDIVNLGKFQIYIKLMIDGVSSQPFSASTSGPIPLPEQSYVNEVIEASRTLFAQPRKMVEENIEKWMQSMKPAPKVSPSKSTSPKSTNPVSEGASTASLSARTSVTPLAKATETKAQVPKAEISPKAVAESHHEHKSHSKGYTGNKSSSHAQKSDREVNATIPPKPVRNVEPPPISENDGVSLKDLLSKMKNDAPPQVKVVETSQKKVDEKNSVGNPQDKPAIKPVSLNNLKKKTDPKAQSPENVNQLREALKKLQKNDAPATAKEGAQNSKDRTGQIETNKNPTNLPNNVNSSNKMSTGVPDEDLLKVLEGRE